MSQIERRERRVIKKLEDAHIDEAHEHTIKCTVREKDKGLLSLFTLCLSTCAHVTSEKSVAQAGVAVGRRDWTEG